MPLDVNGIIRIGEYSTQPAICDSTIDGALVTTSIYTTCICKGSFSSLVNTSEEGVTACNWNTARKIIINSGSFRKWSDGTYAKNCQEYRNPATANTYYERAAGSGVYRVDLDGGGAFAATDVYCDMDTAGGGWSLILNYLHQGNTNPTLSILSTTFPIQVSTLLGTNESGTSSWGHPGNALMNQMDFGEIRFFCKSSGNSYLIHFSHSSPESRSYIGSVNNTHHQVWVR